MQRRMAPERLLWPFVAYGSSLARLETFSRWGLPRTLIGSRSNSMCDFDCLLPSTAGRLLEAARTVNWHDDFRASFQVQHVAAKAEHVDEACNAVGVCRSSVDFGVLMLETVVRLFRALHAPRFLSLVALQKFIAHVSEETWWQRTVGDR